MISKIKRTRLIRYLLARLVEPSTWVGIASLLALFGVQVSTEELNNAALLLGTIVGGFLVAYPQYKRDDGDQDK